MMLANVPIVFADEPLSSSSESTSEIFESSTDSTLENESDFLEVENSTTQSSITEENKTTETTEVIDSETIDTNTSDSQSESSSEEIMRFRAATVTSEKVVGKYTTIVSKDLILWKDFTMQTEIAKSSKYYLQTLYVEKEFTLSDGKKLVSLQDNKKQFLGYVVASSIKIVDGQQGSFQSISKYVSIRGNYTIWRNFKWEKRASASQYKNQTFQAKGIYYHFNGSRYLSLYNNQGKWMGYINEQGTSLAKGQQGVYRNYGRYISVVGNYDFWQNFNWSSRVHSSKYQGQTFLAKGIYYHFNGSRYLSVYDNKGNWLGYLNTAGAKVVSGQQGAYQSYGKNVTIKTNSYAIWRNFIWSRKASGNHLGKTYLAKGVYHHFDGSRYLSLYDSSDRWIGYINSLGTNDSYGDWVQTDGKWYYYTKTGQVTKGWAKIENRWHYFDASGVNIDTNQARFISRSINDVLTITKKHQLFPSIMLAQAILESNYGTSELALKANNFFGMKFKENEDEGKYEKYYVETKEYDATTGETITIRAAFRKYPTRLASFEDNALKLRLGVSWDNNYYSGTWRENAKTYKDASKALTGRYATDPNYGQKLNTRIETWKLNQFD